MADEEIGPVVLDGDLTREEVMKAGKGSLMGGSIAFLVIGILLIALGLFIFFKRGKK